MLLLYKGKEKAIMEKAKSNYLKWIMSFDSKTVERINEFYRNGPIEYWEQYQMGKYAACKKLLKANGIVA